MLIIKWMLVGISIVLFLLVFRPVPALTDSNTKRVSGKITAVHESGIHDVTIVLENNNHHYYINRGLEQGLILDSLNHKWIGQTVILLYPDHWTPLDPTSRGHHVSQVFMGEELVYSE